MILVYLHCTVCMYINCVCMSVIRNSNNFSLVHRVSLCGKIKLACFDKVCACTLLLYMYLVSLYGLSYTVISSLFYVKV